MDSAGRSLQRLKLTNAQIIAGNLDTAADLIRGASDGKAVHHSACGFFGAREGEAFRMPGRAVFAFGDRVTKGKLRTE